MLIFIIFFIKYWLEIKERKQRMDSTILVARSAVVNGIKSFTLTLIPTAVPTCACKRVSMRPESACKSLRAKNC